MPKHMGKLKEEGADHVLEDGVKPLPYAQTHVQLRDTCARASTVVGSKHTVPDQHCV